MFYSHEVLTSRQYGVATVWLVATLGAKSTLKKVNRKAIQDVDVPKACGSIISPEAPMALRLQSNLLYGVTRVYSEQCNYVLIDAQNAHNNMRALLKTIKAFELEGKHRARPDQLNLKEDTQFMLEDLLNFDIDSMGDFDLTSSGTSDLDSLLSPHRSISSGLGSEHADPSIVGIQIPPSVSSSIGAVGGFGLGFGGSAHGGSGKGSRFGSSMFRREEDEQIFDPGFAFDEMGNMIDSDAVDDKEVVDQLGSPTIRQSSVLNEGGPVSAEIRNEADHGHRHEDDYGLPLFQEDFDMYTDADPFPQHAYDHVHAPNSPNPEVNASVEPSTVENAVEPASEDIYDETIIAPALRNRKKKGLAPDVEQELHNHELSNWSNNYLTNMQGVLHGKIHTRSAALAKKNAAFWILQNGVGSLSITFGQETIPEPLRMFTGNALLEALTGARFTVAGAKHPREETVDHEKEDADGDGRRVRLRSDEQEMGRQNDDIVVEDAGYVGDDHVEETQEETVEAGRRGQTPLAEHMSSIMPWNTTASIRGASAQRSNRAPFSADGFATSSAAGGPIGGLGIMSSRMDSRVVSASPLDRRSGTHGTLEPLDDSPLPGLDFANNQDDRSDEHNDRGQSGAAAAVFDPNEQFEAFGPAATAQTQQTNQPAWMRQTLDSESVNFFHFVQANIHEAGVARDPVGSVDSARSGGVLFEALLSPARNNRIVAAQGLLHVLTLVTKNVLIAGQDASFGPINLRIPDTLGAYVSVPVVTTGA